MAAVVSSEDIVCDDFGKWKEILKSFWSRGMTGVGSAEQKKMVEEVSNITGLRYEQIKDWISNTKRRIKTASYEESKCRKRKRRGRDIFYQELMKSEELKKLGKAEVLELVGKRWKGVQESGESVRYEVLASQATTLDEPKEKKLRKLKNQLIKVVEGMEQLGEHLFCIWTMCDKGAIGQTGSSKGQQFLKENPHVSSQFSAYCNAGSDEIDTRSQLQNKVQHLFNTRYYECMGQKKVPYKRIKCREITVSGMPEGVSFKTPGSYGKKDLLAIIRQGGSMSFAVSCQEGSGDTAATTQAAMVASQQEVRRTKPANGVTFTMPNVTANISVTAATHVKPPVTFPRPNISVTVARPNLTASTKPPVTFPRPNISVTVARPNLTASSA